MDDETLAALSAPALGQLFRRPTRLDVISAWYGHIPFSHWIVRACRPDVLVELGTHNGVSFSAFCETVLAEGLPTRCYAVDTWQGDEHAGFYDESVFLDLQSFTASRYSSFAALVRCTFDKALTQFFDGSVDLLHIDGRHHYDDVLHDFTTWLPKLSRRAVVLLHDTNVRERDFGVWRLWGELSSQYPSFEFPHTHGLGVLAVGPDVPPKISELCGLTGEAASSVRERFATLGERWALNALHRRLEETKQWGSKAQKEVDRLYPAYQTCLEAHRATRAQLAEARYALAAAQIAQTLGESGLQAVPGDGTADGAIAFLRRELEAARAECATLRAWQSSVVTSMPWRTMHRLRRLAGRTENAEPPPATAVVAADDRLRILYVSGESDTPGHTYRVLRAIAAAEMLGWHASWSDVAPVNPELLRGAKIVVLWRVPHSQHVQGIIDFARAEGARIVFDIDDLMFRRDYANTKLIDGIRSQRFSETTTQEFFEKIGQTMAAVDLVTCPTEELAHQARFVGKPAFVVPNGFDAQNHAASRIAVRSWRGLDDAILRIGYAGGSRTHQKDFAQAVPALARILHERPQCRLVLFRDPRSGEGLVLTDEFAVLEPVSGQIEWRDMVPLAGMPKELVRFDINLAPLEPDNIFCASKSELKYFEAALVGVPSIVSPVGRMGRAVQHGQTGFIAASEAEWYAALSCLADDPALRARMGRDAYHDALWRYGPQQRCDRLRSLFAEMRGGIEAAIAFASDLQRPALCAQGLPNIPESRVVLQEDRLGQAAVSVIVPVHNYADYVIEALESVASQTLPMIDLVVVDDASTDDSLAMIADWCARRKPRFNRLVVLQHINNAGLAGARNSGFAAAETPFVLPLDADNRLRPTCCERLLDALAGTETAFAYPAIRHFGEASDVIGTEPFSALRLLQGNYIDAMALVAKWAWAAAGGYAHIRYGWEDFDFWARLVEQRQFGISVPEVLADYRVHRASMLHTTTEVHDHKHELVADLTQRHQWLDIGRLADV
jgi:glycosyltransferase involved in cell wall biosynthesis